MRRSVAPVNAPRSWPNISLSTRSRGIAAQFTRTNGRSRRSLAAWIAAATSSLPVPDSPVISTRASVGATRAIIARTCSIAGLSPIISPRQAEIGAQRSRFAPRLAQLQRRRERQQHALGARAAFRES